MWNKSNREHTFIGSEPPSVLEAARSAVKALGWDRGWHVDADHIRLETVDRYIPCSDFFTIDVADSIGQAGAPGLAPAFLKRHPALAGTSIVAGIARPFQISEGEALRVTGKYLPAVQEAGRIYRRIAAGKGEDKFIAEVSMDETDSPQKAPSEFADLSWRCWPKKVCGRKRSRRSSPDVSTRASITRGIWRNLSGSLTMIWR